MEIAPRSICFVGIAPAAHGKDACLGIAECLPNFNVREELRTSRLDLFLEFAIDLCRPSPAGRYAVVR
jgi:hypothetical protein